jgi:hypothetical protein
MKNIILEIDSKDCVGDSVAKHNYNILALDAKVCNLSSLFYNVDDSYDKHIIGFNDYIPKLYSSYQLYNTTSMYRYKTNTVTTQVMSSYWNKHEFTVQLNTNISLSYSNVLIGNYIRTDFDMLCAACSNYLNTNFPVVSYTLPTTAHVIGFHFTSIQPSLSDHVIIKSNPIQYTDQLRTMDIRFSKDPICLSGMFIFSYANDIIRNRWLLARVFPDRPLIPFVPQTIPVPSLVLKSTTSPSAPMYVWNGTSVPGSFPPVNNATITIEYTNVTTSSIKSDSLNLYYSTDKNNILSNLHSSGFTPTGTITIAGLKGQTTYYIQAVNDYDQKSNILTVTTLAYI